ncbi:hypothetical protein VMT65_38035 [Nocardia sp. CDC153]|uniref:hypothetical protein n=1 Tax=Nocardia sp. CDC153 TaxID=3112167 RepID=UPI002DC00BC7|nr:hypothetical protein [Nocardia sp. CDC153]MEC3958886.1 hypothetical protein [Nocardia sp. CDC153]
MGHPGSQYYNPDLTPNEIDTLLRTNYLLVQASQAALGLISSEIVGMAVEPRPGAIVIHVAATRETPALAEDLDDIVSDLHALLSGGPEQNSVITTQVHLGWPDATWHSGSYAPFYIAKPDND